MKLELMKHFVSVRRWAIGLHFYWPKHFTLVALVGTAWHFGFSGRSETAFGFCFGPITIGGAR